MRGRRDLRIRVRENRRGWSQLDPASELEQVSKAGYGSQRFVPPELVKLSMTRFKFTYDKLD